MCWFVDRDDLMRITTAGEVLAPCFWRYRRVILQRPFFDPSADTALQYGALGAAAGHELIHLFDDEERKFDARGAMRDWWTPEDAAQYRELSQCFVDEYGREVAVDDLHINGQLTLGKNLADNGGLPLV